LATRMIGVVDPRSQRPISSSSGTMPARESIRNSATSAAARAALAAIARTASAWPGQGIRISAQLRLERFYGAHGFLRVGEPYIEDTIPHLQMFRP